MSAMISQCKLAPPSSGQRLLLASSGGPDSTALTDLLTRSGYNFALAHMNFQLRGEASDEDAIFVKAQAEKYKLPYFHQAIDTLSEQKKGESTQMVARRLRYSWLETIRFEENFDFILTAHHQNDQAETLLLNLIRGAGLNGLKGMDFKSGRLLRPLLEFRKEEILKYVATNKLEYRIDQSNLEVKYKRNKVRNQLIPLLETMNPSVVEQLASTASRFRETGALYDKALKTEISSCLDSTGGVVKIASRKLAKLTAPLTVLHAILKPANFSSDQIDEIFVRLIQPLLFNKDSTLQTGKHFLSTTHRLVNNRRHLLLLPLAVSGYDSSYFVERGNASLNFHDRQLKISQLPASRLNTSADKQIAQLALEKLKFPLELRRWKKGDYFYPFGLVKKNGRVGKKKVSDFLTDLKLDVVSREQTWVLLSGNKIVWVVGYRIDHRFALQSNSKAMLRLELV